MRLTNWQQLSDNKLSSFKSVSGKLVINAKIKIALYSQYEEKIGVDNPFEYIENCATIEQFNNALDFAIKQTIYKYVDYSLTEMNNKSPFLNLVDEFGVNRKARNSYASDIYKNIQSLINEDRFSKHNNNKAILNNFVYRWKQYSINSNGRNVWDSVQAINKQDFELTASFILDSGLIFTIAIQLGNDEIIHIVKE